MDMRNINEHEAAREWNQAEPCRQEGAGAPTPVFDFVKQYAESAAVRAHMPGHKGQRFLGPEPWDLTEIAGADSLYEASGIIAESERQATALFGTAGTYYATEGSSQCIRAMLRLALIDQTSQTRPVVVAARNVHRAFLTAAALLDFEIVWLWPEETNSLCSCPVTARELERVLSSLPEPPAAVYLTSPDYLGGTADIAALAECAHARGSLLLVDNAHGAYLHFLEKPVHPMDQGADLCCDSAHKTLPVLTGGAYLQISKRAEMLCRYAKDALLLFGSTSPSYLTMASLDLCNRYLSDGYRERLWDSIRRIRAMKEQLTEAGYRILPGDPLRLTIDVRGSGPASGQEVAKQLRARGIECEFSDPEFVVLMLTPENTENELCRIQEAFLCLSETQNLAGQQEPVGGTAGLTGHMHRPERVCSVREAMLSPYRQIRTEDAGGHVCAQPTASCPPAVPVVMPGERIDSAALRLLLHYGYQTVSVLGE